MFVWPVHGTDTCLVSISTPAAHECAREDLVWWARCLFRRKNPGGWRWLWSVPDIMFTEGVTFYLLLLFSTHSEGTPAEKQQLARKMRLASTFTLSKMNLFITSLSKLQPRVIYHETGPRARSFRFLVESFCHVPPLCVPALSGSGHKVPGFPAGDVFS